MAQGNSGSVKSFVVRALPDADCVRGAAGQGLVPPAATERCRAVLHTTGVDVHHRAPPLRKPPMHTASRAHGLEPVFLGAHILAPVRGFSHLGYVGRTPAQRLEETPHSFVCMVAHRQCALLTHSNQIGSYSFFADMVKVSPLATCTDDTEPPRVRNRASWRQMTPTRAQEL